MTTDTLDAFDLAVAKLRKKLRFVPHESRTGFVSWTCGAYEIVRMEYTLPTRSTSYRVLRATKKLVDLDKLNEAKDFIAQDMVERASDIALSVFAEMSLGECNNIRAAARFGGVIVSNHQLRRLSGLGLITPRGEDHRVRLTEELGREVARFLGENLEGS